MSGKNKKSATASNAAEEWLAFQRRISESWNDWLVPGRHVPEVRLDASIEALQTRMKAGLAGYQAWLDGVTAVTAGRQGKRIEDVLQAWLERAGHSCGSYVPPWLLPPSLGFDSEQLAQQQLLVTAILEYLAAVRAYEALLEQAKIEHGERLHQRWEALGVADTTAKSLRQVYEDWVDDMDEAVQETMSSPKFSAVYGAMMNALLKVRELQQRQLALVSRQWGLSTRQEMNALGARLETLRRELRQAQKTMAELEAQLAPQPAEAAKQSPRVASKPRKSRVQPAPARASRKPRKA